MFIKRLFYASATILCLAAAYAIGARSATAQAGSMVSGVVTNQDSGGTTTYLVVVTPSGDVYSRVMNPNQAPGPLSSLGNFWSGTGPTPVQPEALGKLKARYR